MFSVVMFAALLAGENTADFHFKSCYGGAHSCYGGCYGSCYGWSSKAYYGGCYGSACHGGCHGGYSGCYGCGGCFGCCGSFNGPACYGGCFGTCSGVISGGCWGTPYAGYGSACYGGCVGGCGGYVSPAYGVPGPVIGVPVGAAPGMPTTDAVAGVSTDRAKIVFTLPEGAKLYVEGQLIANAAEQKTFRTPVLETGKNYVYSMRIESEKDGEKLVGETTVTVRAGRTEEVDLTAVELKKETKVVAR